MQEAKAFNEDNGNNLWRVSICKEMKNIRPDFEVFEKDISEFPPGYQKIICHMIFDVKMGKKIIRRARFFADRRKNKTPSEMT